MSLRRRVSWIMMFGGLLAGLSFVSQLQAGSASKLPSAKKMLGEIQEKGPEKVLVRLDADQGLWFKLLGKIKTGDPHWLDVAKKLNKAADGYMGEDLTKAVSDALIQFPQQVLPLIGAGFEAEEICQGSIEVDASRAVEQEYLHRLKKALEGIHSSDLQKQAEECLNVVNRRIEGIE